MSDHVINALKRLERAGSEESRQTEKLVAAARVLSEHVAAICDVGHGDYDLPRGYYLAEQFGGRHVLLVAELVEEVACQRAIVTRHAALGLAQDIATGWLDELADWMGSRGAASAEAVAILQNAAEALQ